MILALILSVTIIVQPASADSSTLINFNGRVISSDVDPIIVNGRVLVPLRLISEEIGYSVHWDSNTQTVFVNGIQTNNPGTFPESANGIRLIVNGQTVTGDVAPRIIHNRVMVPVRVISESLNSIVKWESEAKEVLIVQPDRLGQDASRSIETFLTWLDASYDYPPDGTPDDFGKWITGKMNAIEEGYRSVLNYRSILEQVLTASELENNVLYQLLKEASILMEYERESVMVLLIHPDALEKLIEIAAKLQ